MFQEIIEALSQSLDLVRPDTGGNVRSLLDIIVFVVGFRNGIRDAHDAVLVNKRKSYLAFCLLQTSKMHKNGSSLTCFAEQPRYLLHHSGESVELAG
ncbi:hypothetical protein BGV47_23625 [Burkholderia ubonensis]|nr:hypothetical protein BGV47_23625 [Burkholderia ubonensis]OJB30543.1 hypothetical protein BGV55_12310 [Burkholderia ubonensis]